MSDNLPLEIQAEILKRLPIKSLIRSRSVSKPWKSLIDSSEFIADFNLYQSEPQHLFVSYNNGKYVSVLDDNTFPQHKFPVSFNVNQLSFPIIIGSSQGLFCLCSYNNRNTETVVIWNPAIRKAVVISVPNVLPFPYETLIGFGICPHTNHTKLVKFIYKKEVNFMYQQNREIDAITIPSRVEICTSKSRVWRTISTNLPRKSIALTKEHVSIDRFIYWLGYDRKYVGDKVVHRNNLILLFDITNEEFTEEINPLDGLQRVHVSNMRISKLSDSLVVLVRDIRAGGLVYDVWMMENSVSVSFRKLYTIEAPNASIVSVLGFRKSGEPIIYMISDSDEDRGLFVYDSATGHVNYIGISIKGFPYSVSSYVESLLLLDH